MIEKYEIIKAGSCWELTDQVNNKLSLGWEIYGSPLYGNGNFYQTVIKRNYKHQYEKHDDITLDKLLSYQGYNNE